MRREIHDRTILFLCEDNACLSQMAEGAARHLGPPKTRVFSAGVRPGPIPNHVLQAMKELGIDIAGQRSKGLAEVPIQDVDLVVSFGDAHKKCANLPPRAKVESWPIPKDLEPNTSTTPDLPVVCDEGEKIQRRVFALLLDHWRNNA